MKRGGSGVTPRNWRRRWFVIRDDCIAYYYSSPEVHVGRCSKVVKKPYMCKSHCLDGMRITYNDHTGCAITAVGSRAFASLSSNLSTYTHTLNRTHIHTHTHTHTYTHTHTHTLNRTHTHTGHASQRCHCSTKLHHCQDRSGHQKAVLVQSQQRWHKDILLCS